MSQDFSQLEEFFYPDVSANVGVSLSGFARKATEYYEQKQKRGAHVFRFDSVGMDDSLILTIRSYACTYVAQARIRQTTEDLESILRQLRGDLKAHYAGLALTTPTNLAPAHTIIDHGRLLLLQLSGRRDEDIATRLNALSKAVQGAVAEADSFDVESAEYENDDPHGVLVHTKCRIRKAAAEYAFDYAVGTANLDPLPKSYLDRAEAIFQLASPKFRKVSAYRARMMPFRKAERND